MSLSSPFTLPYNGRSPFKTRIPPLSFYYFPHRKPEGVLPYMSYVGMCRPIWERFCPGGWTPHMKGVGMLVVSVRGVNFGFWFHLGCSGQNAIIFSREGLV